MLAGMVRVLRNRWRTAFGLALVAVLAGCAGHFIAQREPWRKEAELACLKSGSVREGVTIVRVDPINGPGMCGADYPLKVAALGESTALGYSEQMRPPGNVPNAGTQRWPVTNDAFVPSPPPGRNDQQRIDANNDPFGVAASRARKPSGYDAPQPVQAMPSRAPVSVPLGRDAVAAVGPVEIKPPATLACPIVSALDRWITDAVQPAAQRWFRQPVTEIRQISAYSCRGMNGQPGAHISEHAFGNALDIAAFTFADGRKITVKNGWRGSPEEQGFLRDVQGAACDSFNTVLAPGSNRFHYDHIHVDLMRRGSGHKICNPDQIPGEVVAARVARERGYAWRPEPGVTGSIQRNRTAARAASLNGKPAKAKSRNILEDDDWVEDEGPRPAE